MRFGLLEEVTQQVLIVVGSREAAEAEAAVLRRQRGPGNALSVVELPDDFRAPGPLPPNAIVH